MNVCKPYGEGKATHLLFPIPPNTIGLQDVRHTYLSSSNFIDSNYYLKERNNNPTRVFPSFVQFHQETEQMGQNISYDILKLRDRERLEFHSKPKSW